MKHPVQRGLEKGVGIQKLQNLKEVNSKMQLICHCSLLYAYNLIISHSVRITYHCDSSKKNKG